VSENPSGSIEKTLKRARDSGRDDIRGLEREREIDKSKFDPLS
jgi:hypothetical protein